MSITANSTNPNAKRSVDLSTRNLNCVQYLSEKLSAATALNNKLTSELSVATSLNNKLTNELSVAKNQFWIEAKVLTSSAAEVKEFLTFIKFNYNILWQHFRFVPQDQNFSNDVLFQYRDTNFRRQNKEAFARVVVSSIAQGDTAYSALGCRIEKKLLKKASTQSCSQVVVGSEFFCLSPYEKYIAFHIADIHVLIYVRD